jgi:hypothetical protein
MVDVDAHKGTRQSQDNPRQLDCVEMMSVVECNDETIVHSRLGLSIIRLSIH